MKSSSVSIRIVFVLLLFLFNRCKKEENAKETEPAVEADYRDKYCGSFLFTIINQSWMLGQPTVYDTSQYLGNISKLDLAQFEESISVTNPEERLLIIYGSTNLTNKMDPFRRIIPRILANDSLVPESGYHYHHSGHFATLDSISFKVTGLGGLGGGNNLFISGIRQ